MAYELPTGRRVAVALTLDFDAHSPWMGTMGRTTLSYLSRGEFGAEVGVPRLLDLFDRYEVPATWFTPGHDLVTFPHRIEQILARGDEIAAHGCYHEVITELDPARERELMELQLEQHRQVVGARPTGYRSPAWDFSDVTFDLLQEYGFSWDSSLMGRDFELYKPRKVEVNYEAANVFSEESSFVEVPVSWYLDDWPAVEYVAGVSNSLGDHEVMGRRWRQLFDFAHTEVDQAVYVLTMHPQTIGRGHHLMVLKQLIEHIRGHDDVWFATVSQIAGCWTD